MKRINLLTLCLLLVFTLFQLVFSVGENICEINGIGYSTLNGALTAVQNGETIRLLKDIDYAGGIVVEDKCITFDLNGYTLNVNNPLTDGTDKERTGLYLEGNAVVDLKGEGKFNVKGNKYGVFVYVKGGTDGNASATVTNATATGNNGCAAVANGENAVITVKGDAIAKGVGGIGAMANSSGLVTVRGNVTADNFSGENECAAVVTREDGEVIVNGSVTATGTNSIGVRATSFGNTVGRNVTGILGGAYANASASIDITGNVQSNGIGVLLTGVPKIDTPSEITIHGVISAPHYIQIGSFTLAFDDYVLDSDIIPGYRFYITDSNLSGVLVSEFDGGDGSEGTPYLIATPEQLNNMRHYLGTESADKHFKLTADLDLNAAPYNSGVGWVPIGTSAFPFTGSFDGDGHTINNLFIKQVGSWNNRVPAGLFGYADVSAKISNLSLESIDITGFYYVGSLVGNNSCEITNVSASGSVTGEWDTGGLVGKNNGSITDSVFMGDVTGSDIIEYGDWTGGLTGYNSGTITRCRADATVVSKGDNVGGLVGENLTNGIITDSCSSGTVTADDYTGGLVGSNIGKITLCYSLCAVNGYSDVGGLVGGNSGQIVNSFTISKVEGTNRIGGLIGSNTDVAVTGSYWDKETSLLNTSAGGTGKTTAEMKQQETYDGWDFATTWVINANFNDGYPFLRWQVTAKIWEVANATQLEAALNGFQSGDTIKLTADFAYNKGIIINGKDITFDTNNFTLNVYSSTDSSPGVGLEVKNGGNVYLIGSGQLYIRQIGGNNSYGVKVTDGSTAMVTNIQVTVYQNDAAIGAYADGTNSSIHVLGNVNVMGKSGCGAKTSGRSRITVDETITAMIYINIDYTYKDKSSGVSDSTKPDYLKYCNAPVIGIVWVKVSPVTVPAMPQDFTATPGDGQVEISWTAPSSDGGNAVIKYQVSKDNGTNWTDVGLNISHTFTGLTNGTTYTFKVRATNSAGNGVEASATIAPIATPTHDYAVTINSGTGSGNYAEGSTVNITASPAPTGKEFDKWTTTDGVIFADTYTETTSFTMIAKTVTVTATYKDLAPDTFAVTVHNDGNGTASANCNMAAEGSVISLTATPNSGYRFKEWQVVSGDVNITDNKFTMPPSNVTLKAIFEEIPVETPVYIITEGANGSWRTDASDGMKIICDGDFAKFTGIKVDGTLLTQDKYSAVSGGTIVTLKPEYLVTLSEGKHTVEFIYSDGSAVTNLTVLTADSGKTEENPQTDDNSNMTPLYVLMLLSGTVIIGAMLYGKKRHTSI